MNNGNVFQQLIAATFPVGGYQMHWLELIGILIGAASAYLGMKRWVWAWPVGILANVMLFFVYLGALFGADERIPLFGQAGRQIFFIVTSLYGWWRWNESKRARGVDNAGPAITPRWATSRRAGRSRWRRSRWQQPPGRRCRGSPTACCPGRRTARR